jgi:hypothetical protein
LEADPSDALARTLAAFGWAIDERESQGITGVQGLLRNPALDSNRIGADQFATSKSAPQPPLNDPEAVKTHWLRVLLALDNPS